MNCMIAQSGGPTVAINASLAGVLKANEATKSYDKIYGALNGIVGVLHHNFLELTSLIEEEDNFIDRLIHTPAMYLGSCRYKIPFGDEGQEIYRQVFKVFEEYQIGAFFYIGGNDSMDTVDKLSKYGTSINSSVRIVGIPKTIDNDLVTIDHTPGFGSAAK
ncbi:MAG: 6-phosphofructokinase, partial [Lachnospiraceae bacterium]|nr:6-phosphofructokinase [Lachnospiraceae bacterium]